MVCGEALEYLDAAQDMVCAYCGGREAGHIRCSRGHFICEECHNRDAEAVIRDIVFTTDSRDPLATAERMMDHPSVPMLGCQHAYIAAGALMSALRNETSGRISNDNIREVFGRIGRQAVGGYCGLTGVCGIVPAIGACVSLFLGAHCGADKEQRITMEAVTRVSQAITDLTGPSCCKAYVRAGLGEAVRLFEEKFGITLPVANAAVQCKHSERHPHGCRTRKCPYYTAPARDIFADSIHLPVTACHT